MPLLDLIAELYEGIASADRAELVVARRALGGALVRLDRREWDRRHARVYRALHAEKVRIYQNEWRKRHPRPSTYDPSRQRAYRDAHREEIRERDRAYEKTRDQSARYWANPEAYKQRATDWQKKNRDRHNATKRAYWLANREAINRARRERRRKTHSESENSG